MMLLVDAGNTRIKWRIVAGRALQASRFDELERKRVQALDAEL